MCKVPGCLTSRRLLDHHSKCRCGGAPAGVVVSPSSSFSPDGMQGIQGMQGMQGGMGMPSMQAMQGMRKGWAQNPYQMPGMSPGMQGMHGQGIPGMPPMLGGVPPGMMPGMQPGMPMPGMQGMQGMHGMAPYMGMPMPQGMQMQGMQGLPGMPSMPMFPGMQFPGMKKGGDIKSFRDITRGPSLLGPGAMGAGMGAGMGGLHAMSLPPPPAGAVPAAAAAPTAAVGEAPAPYTGRAEEQ
mmetsp:Transcript_9305/g.20597  ORF Transcript_9305/g.20597 Transcript_9305/m.20597 type:complete len:239 (-) Transcript_9305:251-967(-)